MPEMHELIIEKMVTGGLGLGHLADGMVVLVSHVLPGERVQVKTVAKRKSYLEAKLVEVLEQVSGRIPPPCPVYGRCGGCDLQHAAYGLQLELKQQILMELLFRSLHLMPWELEKIVLPPLGANEPFGYRQRIRLQIASKTQQLGFNRAGSHKIEPIRSCLLARSEINMALLEIEAFAGQALLKFAYTLELLLSPDDKMVIAIIHCNRRPRPNDLVQARALIKAGGMIKEILFSVADQGVFSSSGKRADTAENSDVLAFTLATPKMLGQDICLRLEPGGFCQVNQSQNEQLVALLLDWAEIEQHHKVLDLFCGMGNFSLPLAVRAKAVTGFDLKRSAIRSANRNAVSSGLTHCRFTAKDAVVAAKELVNSGERFDLVLLDPPRQGCVEVIPYLAALAARTILYISCDPATFCRDLTKLSESGFELDRIKLVDMFPQTHHIEVVACLQKR